MKISCIIAALNEEKQIANVLDAALKAKEKIPMEIIVVDDGSNDSTPHILKGYKGIRVLTNNSNKGKSYSVARGIEASKGEYILLLDADLFGLTADNIHDLITPVQLGVAEVTMSIRKNYVRTKLESITGERVFPRSLVNGHLDKMKELPNFSLEVFLNDLIIKGQYPIKAVNWVNVVNKNKTKRRGFYRGWKENIGATRDVFRIMPFKEATRQHNALKKLLVK